MQNSMMPKEGSIIHGKYKLVRKIGEGGMGVVYLAEHLTLNTHFALKILKPQLAQDDNIRKRFIDEAKRHAKLSHENIVKVTDAGTDGIYSFFVMEYISGEDLGKKLQKRSLRLDEVMQYLNQIVSALKYVHDRRMVHRDIKPSNFLVSNTGRIVITDFGIAKSLDAKNTESFTRGGEIVGTPEYMAPEQFDGRASTVCDLYSLGVVVYELLTGKKAFYGHSYYEIIRRVKEEYPPLPSKVSNKISSSIDTFLRKAIDKSPTLRFQSVTQFHQEFYRSAGLQQDSHFKQSPLVHSRMPGSPRQPLIIAGITISLVILLTVFIILFLPKQPSPIIQTGEGFLLARSNLGYSDVTLKLDDRAQEQVTLPLQRSMPSGQHRMMFSSEKIEKDTTLNFTIKNNDTTKLEILFKMKMTKTVEDTNPPGLPGTTGAIGSFGKKDEGEKVQPILTSCTLQLQSDMEAYFFFDGEELSGQKLTSIEKTNIKAGTYVIKAMISGGQTIEKTVMINPGKESERIEFWFGATRRGDMRDVIGQPGTTGPTG